MFHTVQPFTREDLARIDPEFDNEFTEILDLPRGGGYWLWKFPLLEHMLRQATSVDEYIFYVDAGCSILSTSSQGSMDRWLTALEKSNKEILRFEYPKIRFEIKWCVTPLFHAFNLSCNKDENRGSIWKECMGNQLPATGFIVRNGVAAREMLAMIYDALAVDPWIITDVYGAETRAKDPRGFNENRHDQCLLSIATKLIDSYITFLSPRVEWSMKRHKVLQFSRVSGPRTGQSGIELDPKTFAYWKKECVPRNRSKDYFCDEVSLHLHREDIESGRLEFRLTNIWNRSIDEVLQEADSN
jgi:hypothetical protein